MRGISPTSPHCPRLNNCCASYARSGQVIDERVRPTLEAGSKVGSKKPVCVIIDEIDGATGAGDNVRFSLSKTFV